MLQDIEKLTLTWLQLVKRHIELFLLEAKLARMSILPVIISTLFLISLTVFTWSYLLIAASYSIYLLTHNIFMGISAVSAGNVILLLLLWLYLSRSLRRLRFPLTRAALKNYQTIKEGQHE